MVRHCAHRLPPIHEHPRQHIALVRCSAASPTARSLRHSADGLQTPFAACFTRMILMKAPPWPVRYTCREQNTQHGLTSTRALPPPVHALVERHAGFPRYQPTERLPPCSLPATRRFSFGFVIPRALPSRSENLSPGFLNMGLKTTFQVVSILKVKPSSILI